MITFQKAQEIINREIRTLPLEGGPGELYEPIRYILSIGGKRIRPALVLMACSLFSDEISHAKRCSLAVEIFHNFTLLHDDIMDNSPLRRNQPTVHEKWNRNVAILSGDAMSILSYKLLEDCPDEFLPEVLRLFSSTALQVCEGQQYDLNFESRNDITVEDYLDMIHLKTSVLIAASLKLGAILGRALPADSELMYEFGKNIGMAFQLKDDILDVFGDSEKFGKKIGNDILANKKTFLLLKAFERADGEAGKELRELMLKDPVSPDEKIQKVIGIFNRLGVEEIAETRSKEFFHEGIRALNKVSVEDYRKTALRDVVHQLMEREF